MKMETETINLNVNWNSETSIKLAEKNKLALENKGYQLVNQFGGMNHSTMVYMKGGQI